MPVPLAESILKVCKAGLEAYKTHLATRQEAYNRKADKKQVKAIETAEKYIFANDKLIESLTNLYPKTVAGKAIQKHLGSIDKCREKFFKYN